MSQTATLFKPTAQIGAAVKSAPTREARVRAPSALALHGVAKSFGSAPARTEVLHNVNLSIAEGEFVAIVGFSGSGKTTLVSLLAGLVQADAGEVLKAGLPVLGPGPDRGVVFQSYSLMPWLSVSENVALAVDCVFAGQSRAERTARTAHYVDMVGLSAAAYKRPAELSGGMRQRVAVARALAANPDVLLLDEPLSALDALTRANLQDEFTRIWTEEKKTVLLITNDVDEALVLADRIIPLDPGPRASLGPSFDVDLPRPRDRRELNHDPRFKELRSAITQYLIEAGGRRTSKNAVKIFQLPSLKPRAIEEPEEKKAWRLPQFFRMRHSGWLEALEATENAALPTAKTAAKPVAKPHDERFVELSRLAKTYPTPTGPQKVVD